MFVFMGHVSHVNKGKQIVAKKMKVIAVYQEGGIYEMISVPIKNMIKIEALSLS